MSLGLTLVASPVREQEYSGSFQGRSGSFEEGVKRAGKTAYMQGKRGGKRFSPILQPQAEASMVNRASAVGCHRYRRSPLCEGGGRSAGAAAVFYASR